MTSATAALMARPEDLNQSTGVGTHGILWPDTAEEADEGDLIPRAEDELYSGFSSLEGMLQWAIGFFLLFSFYFQFQYLFVSKYLIF